ncbi:F-box/LRR-repeat protein [Pyrus ussuriensis x Pyrus communis]|uniref:F-box/LRR-repeat protein n=1 Tax=Pyrus ussuriensis x Pyrus communis TaxID=2448454 RepID=A0A5N5GIK2_9ROSA|nr:F-box/LRR-repeat protein [Pyrus ussuriensis x Pyrus communis]
MKSRMEETSSEAPNTRNLNDLPEELLLHILSFLPTLDSVQTSLISRKWRPLWSRVPSLNFNYQLFPPYEPPLDTRDFYAEFIDRVLISRPNSPVHTFRLSFIYHHYYASHVDSWLRSAVTNLRARELYLHFFIDLNFHNDEGRNHIYDFRFSLLRNGCVEKLILMRCDLTLPAKLSTMRFGSIRFICFDHVYLEDPAVKDLLSACPNMEVFEINGCLGPHHLEICSTSLKRLILEFGYITEKKQTLLVDCPKLCSISIHRCDFEECVLKNASSLVEFHVDFPHQIDKSYRPWSNVVRLLEQAPNVKYLNVQNWWFKFLTSKNTFPESFVLHNLKLLVLRTGFTRYDLVGMAALLKLCANLETLIVESPFKMEKDESLPEEILKKPVHLSMPSLKQVKMKAFNGRKRQGSFVKILLRQGVVLEKIVLLPDEVDQNEPLPPIILNRKVSQAWELVTEPNSG